ncbi:hypothetical protein HY483_01015 [Candidatus Woesearchaeota archaeon]|nr:hypothetical protein [Candidatus Woesearchaeota archaeon]
MALGERAQDNSADPSFWQDSNAVQSASPEQVISGINSGAVTINNVNSIPAGTLSQVVGSLKDEHIKVLDQSKINEIGISKFSNTQRQLLKDGQVSKKALNDLSSNEWSSLSRETLNGVLSRESGRVVDVHLVSGDVGGEVTDKGFKVVKASFVAVDDIAFTSAEGVEVSGDDITVSKGKDQYLLTGGKNVMNAQKFENLGYNTKTKTFKIQKASQVSTQQGEIMGGVQDVKIVLSDKKVTITTSTEQTFTTKIKDELAIVKTGKDSSLILENDKLTGTKIELSFSKKLLFGGDQALEMTHDVQCLNCERKTVDAGSCWSLSDTSSYTFSTIGTSIQFKTPDLLCIVDKPYVCTDCSVFNTVDRTIKTNSAVLSIEKSLNSFDNFSARTSGDATFRNLIS